MQTKAVIWSPQEGEQTSTNLTNVFMAYVIRVAGTHFLSWPDFSIILTAKSVTRGTQDAQDTIFPVYADIPKDLYGIWKSQMTK